MQIVYIGTGFYGWYWWLYGGADKTELPISLTPRRLWSLLVVIGSIATYGLTRILDSSADSNLPFLDAATTILSLIAQ